MKIYENACNCRFCLGTVPFFIKKGVPRVMVAGTAPDCLWDNGTLKATIPGENPIRYAYSGGRRPVCVILEDGEDVQFTKNINPLPGEIARFEASVHGCFKIRKWKYMVVVKTN